MGHITVRAKKGATQDRVAGQFAKVEEKLQRACEAAALDVADRVAQRAISIRESVPYNFTIHIAAHGGGTHYDVTAEGRFAAMLENGSPRHTIGAPGKWLVNELSGGKSSHWPDPNYFKVKRPVSHPGLERYAPGGLHYMGKASRGVNAREIVVRHINL